VELRDDAAKQTRARDSADAERRRAEEALKQSEERFQQVAENAREWIWEVDAEGLYLYASPAVERILGYSPEEIVGKKHFYDLFHPEVRDKSRQAAFEVFAERLPFREFLNRNMHKDGTEVWLLTSGVPMVDENAGILGYRGADTDVTDRRRAEARLRLLSSAVEQTSEGIAVVNVEGDLLFVNFAFAAIHGYLPEEVVGEHLSIFHTPEQMPSVEAANRQVEEEGDFSGEIWHKRRDGTVFPSRMQNTLLQDASGHPIGMIAAIRDITERKQAEEALLRAKKEVDLYLDLMTHDLTTFNQACLGNLDLLEEHATLDERQARHVQICKRQVIKSDNLISKVRAFSQVKRIDSETLEAFDLNRSVTEAIETVKRLYPGNLVEVEFRPTGNAKALGTGLFDSVLLNVIENAVKHASSEKVCVRISLTEAEKAPDRLWEIRVEDTGPGVPDLLKERIFDRYSRIGTERGLGLGLSLARAITEKLGGSIWMEDRVPGDHSKGSAVRISIPKG